ncbi:class I SAM-dependent methyltransferase [Bifidobacterium oedipodis]|uniref:SAM-dependent methyltransferase n=1 Tax=Bifidobacterium oedipodis TaxID=2675322 RepID=A0A7Y0ENI4_9BIFI|nr:class I SAM-dependent methyltransferase [Bifidobacterium sp. DSM 109957]NMM93501.1 SAM-dependent methyltransferase [Bifidobacterium sp. DSM 109957]
MSWQIYDIPMQWDAKLYDSSHAFVAQYGQSLETLIPSSTQSILDLGCGTGTLTADLARHFPYVIGVDSSPQMIDRATAEHPDIKFQLADATALPFTHEFDVVFSNAVFHWIVDHDALLHSVNQALRPGGMLVCEFGAHGNIAHIERAMSTVLLAHGHTHKPRFNFPTDERFRESLQCAGFNSIHVVSFDRPTPLSAGEQGLSNWLRQFYADDFSTLSPHESGAIIREVSDYLRPQLWDQRNGQWVADYRRLRAAAAAAA